MCSIEADLFIRSSLRVDIRFHFLNSQFVSIKNTYAIPRWLNLGRLFPANSIAIPSTVSRSKSALCNVEILHCKSHMQRLDGIVLYVPADVVVHSEKLFCIHDARSFYMKITSVDGENVLCRIHFMLASSCVWLCVCVRFLVSIGAHYHIRFGEERKKRKNLWIALSDSHTRDLRRSHLWLWPRVFYSLLLERSV